MALILLLIRRDDVASNSVEKKVLGLDYRDWSRFAWVFRSMTSIVELNMSKLIEKAVGIRIRTVLGYRVEANTPGLRLSLSDEIDKSEISDAKELSCLRKPQCSFATQKILACLVVVLWDRQIRLPIEEPLTFDLILEQDLNWDDLELVDVCNYIHTEAFVLDIIDEWLKNQ